MSRLDDALRDRAHELMRLGLSNREIGRRLDVSHTTIGRYRLAEGTVGPWTSCAAPFSGEPSTGAPNAPPMNHHADQPPPPPQPMAFRQGYHDRTFKSFSALLGFEGWDLDRVRNAIALHDQGIFMESSLLTIVVTRFAPLFAALKQAVAPVLALPRKVDGGTRGLARLLRDEVEAQLAPRAGLMPSVYFPPTLWGSAAIDLRMMGFSVLQHVYGDPDPDTAVRPVYTRRWPTWATHYYRYRRTYVALTTDGPVDIVSGDGKFTLLADTEEPHFDGAIRALALEVLDGSLTKQARNSYIDRYGNPKWVGFMPPNTSVRSPEGDAMFDALETLQGPDGTGVLPYGADFKTAQMTSAQNSVFDSALENVWRHVAAALLGSDGTMSPSTGVYSAPIFAGVRRDLIDQVLKCMVRGVNMGHVAPFLSLNYAASIAEAAGWVDPVLDIPLPDPEAEARMKAYKERALGLSEIVEKERAAGFIVTQERVDQIAYELGVAAPKLAEQSAVKGWNVTLAPTTQEKLLRVDEGRAALGGDPIGDERGQLLIVEMDAAAEAQREERKAEAEAEAEIEVEEAVEGEDGEGGGEGGDGEEATEGEGESGTSEADTSEAEESEGKQQTEARFAEAIEFNNCTFGGDLTASSLRELLVPIFDEMAGLNALALDNAERAERDLRDRAERERRDREQDRRLTALEEDDTTIAKITDKNFEGLHGALQKLMAQHNTADLPATEGVPAPEAPEPEPAGEANPTPEPTPEPPPEETP